MRELKLVALALSLGVALPVAVLAAPPLSAVGAKADSVTVSGISSGGYMAVQFQVAWSRLVKGAGILAAGPYDCAEGSVWRALVNCMSPHAWATLPTPVEMRARVDARARSGLIDPPAGLADDKVWVFSGGGDRTVARPVVDALVAFYRQWVPASVLQVVSLPNAGHAMISVADAHPNACATSESPYINRCGDFDAPGELFAQPVGATAATRPGGTLQRCRPSISVPSSTARPLMQGWPSRATPMFRAVAAPAAVRCMWPSTAACRAKTRSAGVLSTGRATTSGPRRTG